MFGVQLKTAEGWQWIHPMPRYPDPPTPYTFPTAEAAESCMRMCYPDQVRGQHLGGEIIVRVLPYPGETK